jgi:hypothetical protein
LPYYECQCFLTIRPGIVTKLLKSRQKTLSFWPVRQICKRDFWAEFEHFGIHGYRNEIAKNLNTNEYTVTSNWFHNDKI